MKPSKLLAALLLMLLAAPSLSAQISVGVCCKIKDAETARQAGAQYIEESVVRFLVPDRPDSEFEAMLAAAKSSPLPIRAYNVFLPKNMIAVGPDADHEAILRWAETAFRRAQMTGGHIIVFGSGKARNIPEGFDHSKAERQFVNLLRRMGPIAERYDITVVVEPLNRKECNFINSVTEGVRLVKRAGHKNIRCLADIYHMLTEGEGPDAIVKGGKYIRHCHVAEKNGRTAPGVNGEDLRPYYHALHRIGYDGRVSIECRWNDFNSQVGPAISNLKQNTAKKK